MSEKDRFFILGRENVETKTLSELLSALETKFGSSEYPAQSEEIVRKAEGEKLSFIPFPYGINPSTLSELLLLEPTHRACCVLKARGLLASEWRVERKDGGIQQPPAEVLARVEEVFPDGVDAVIYPAALDYEAIGNAYLEVIRRPDLRYPNGFGEVVRVVHVPAFSVRRLPPDHPSGCDYVQIYGGEEVYFREFGKDQPVKLDDQGQVTELIHIRNLGGQSTRNYWYGLPDIIAALPAVHGIQEAMEYLTGYLSAKGAPNYFLILSGAGDAPNPEDYALLNRYFNEAMEKGPGRIVVFPTPPSVEAELTPLSLGADPMEVIRYIHECRDQIARVHGIPLRLISVLEAGQLGSTGEAQAQLEFFKRYVIRPRQAMWENLLTKILFDEVPGLQGWRIRFGEITLEDALRLAQADAFGVRFGFMTPNEARAKRGLEPKPGGDELLLLAGGEPMRVRDLGGDLIEPKEEEEKARSKKPGMRIQTLLFDKEVFRTAEEARRWAEEHDFLVPTVEETQNHWRIRQFDPSICQPGTFRTIDIREGVQAVVCRPAFPLSDDSPLK